MAANNDSPRSPPLNEQRPNNQRLGIEIPLGLPEHLPQEEMTPSPVVPDEDHDHFGHNNKVHEGEYWIHRARAGDH